MIRDPTLGRVGRTQVHDRLAALQTQQHRVVTPPGVDAPPRVAAAQNERVIATCSRRRLVYRQRLATFEEPRVIDVELLSARQGWPALLLLGEPAVRHDRRVWRVVAEIAHRPGAAKPARTVATEISKRYLLHRR